MTTRDWVPFTRVRSHSCCSPYPTHYLPHESHSVNPSSNEAEAQIETVAEVSEAKTANVTDKDMLKDMIDMF